MANVSRILFGYGDPLRRLHVKKSEGGINPIIEILRRVSPFLVFCVVYYVLSVAMHISYKVWVPVALGATIIESIIVLGRLYKPFFVDKTGKCIASRDTTKTVSMENCRHYFPGSQFGGCGRRQENGLCRLRRR
jgi:hypothetical protein